MYTKFRRNWQITWRHATVQLSRHSHNKIERQSVPTVTNNVSDKESATAAQEEITRSSSKQHELRRWEKKETAPKTDLKDTWMEGHAFTSHPCILCFHYPASSLCLHDMARGTHTFGIWSEVSRVVFQKLSLGGKMPEISNICISRPRAAVVDRLARYVGRLEVMECVKIYGLICLLIQFDTTFVTTLCDTILQCQNISQCLIVAWNRNTLLVHYVCRFLRHNYYALAFMSNAHSI